MPATTLRTLPRRQPASRPTLNADNPDLSAFRAHGGKLIIDNGWMDGSMSAYGTLKYYENVLSQDPSARDDVRLFLRPGVTHCMIGPGPDGTNYLAAIDEWVESGEAPEQFCLRRFRALLPGQPEGGGRILCAHPNVVTYNGNGDPRDPRKLLLSASAVNQSARTQTSLCVPAKRH